MADLAAMLERHRNAPFPASVVKGEDYGDVEPVMIDADIFGWALSVAAGGVLSRDDRRRLQSAHDDLLRSLDAFPDDARPYYARLVEIASAALA